MHTLEAIFSRRSVREFDGQPVAVEALRQVLQAGAVAPSGGNVQQRAFVLVEAPLRLLALRSLAPGIIGKPGAVVAICLEGAKRLSAEGVLQEAASAFLWVDIGIALQNMLLAAHSLGLGACPVASFHAGAVAGFLKLPQNVTPALLLALGYPKRGLPASPGRRPLKEVLFAESWGAPYGR